jgi:PKD repeat protein
VFTNATTVNDGCPQMHYAWSFGDGQTSTSTNPTHTYTSGGTYTVTLIATNGNGGKKDTATSSVTVVIKPQAAFTSNVDYGGDIYSNPTVSFTDGTSSTDLAASYTYAWDFGTGATPATSTSATPPSVTYAAGGNHTVQLIVTNTNGGLKDTISHTVTTVITPKAILSVHSAIVAVPVPMSVDTAYYKNYTLTALNNPANPSTIATGSIAHTEIKIDSVHIPSYGSAQYALITDVDGNFSIALDTGYLNSYVFSVRLIVTSNLGISDTTYATLGSTEAGFTAFRGLNPNSVTPNITLPTIGATHKPVVAAPIVDTKKGLLVYPNPASEMITVGVDLTTKTSNVNVLLYNSNGRLVQNQKNAVDNVNATRVNVPMNITSLSSGIYNIIVLDNKGVILGMGQCVKSRN